MARILVDTPLVAAGIKAVTLMMNGDAPGRTAIPELLPVLARRLFVRVAELPDGLELDTAEAEIIRELVGFAAKSRKDSAQDAPGSLYIWLNFFTLV